MASSGPEERSVSTSAAQFATTHWSTVLAAGDSALPGSREALDKLCGVYWFPVYAFVRRSGRGPDEASDLTQGFFVYLLERRVIAKANARVGRFRSFLLGTLKHYLLQQTERQGALRRGGKEPLLSLDTEGAERRFAADLATTETPETLFERKWALTVLDETMKQLEGEYRQDGKGAMFEALYPFLEGDDAPHYAALAGRLRLSEGAARVAVYRLRQRYRERLRAVVAQTVANPLELDAELRELMRVLER
jgi:RNA polymerase sigma-70 factor (ECF subfamily)